MRTPCLIRVVSVPGLWGLLLFPCTALWAADPFALRIEGFLVPPASSPLASVVIKNLQDVPYQGSVSLKGPEGWRFSPASRDVSLAPGETQRVTLMVQNGTNAAANSYPFEIFLHKAASGGRAPNVAVTVQLSPQQKVQLSPEQEATGGRAPRGDVVTKKQQVVCTSAPYFKPTIDGNPDEWKESIPVTFATGGKKTAISTYWNRRQLALLVAVEEDKLVPYGAGQGGFDAVQVAIAPAGTRTGDALDGEATRWEFLLVATGQGRGGKCFQLASPGMKLSEGQKARELGPLEYAKAELAVNRVGSTTYYECAFPWTPMREQIQPSEGREFCLSVLVHDPDGTGLRDWGEAAGLWPWQRNVLAWSRFPGAKWGNQAPFDNKIPWGLCSSLY